MASSITLSQILRILSATFLIGGGHPLITYRLNYEPGVSYQYVYTTELRLNESPPSQRPSTTSSSDAGRDVGVTVSASVTIATIWRASSVSVIKLQMSDVAVSSVSPTDQATNSLGTDGWIADVSRLPVYFQSDAGLVTRVFISGEDSLFSINLKKGVISLLQFRRFDDAHISEVDTSGECDITYIRLDAAHLKKIKGPCRRQTADFHQLRPLLGVNVTSSMQTDYMISGDVIDSAIAQESMTSCVMLDGSLSARVTSRQELTFRSSAEKSSLIQASSVDAVVKKLGKKTKHGLTVTSLETTYERRECTQQTRCSPPPSLSDVISSHRGSLASSFTGSVAAAVAVNDVITACRSASQRDVTRVLTDPDNTDIRLTLIDAVSAAQTSASHAALVDVIKFDVTDSSHVNAAERYLLATSMNSHPSDDTVRHILTLYKKRVDNAQLRESIGDALGAIIHTVYVSATTVRHDVTRLQLVSEVQSAMVTSLSDCHDDSECQLPVLRSLGNARLPETIDRLIELAIKSTSSAVSETSLSAVSRFDAHLLQTSDTVQTAVRDIFYQRHRGYDSAVRSQALKLMMTSWRLSRDDVHQIAEETTDPYNTDYALYVQTQLFALAQRNQTVREMLRPILADVQFGNYDKLAPSGKSLAFTSTLAESDVMLAKYHMYLENSRSGVMKRSGMDVDITSSVDDHLQTLPVYSFKLFAAGLDGLLGDDADGTDKDVDVTAGLALDLLGVSLRPITFFVGQTGLMSAVWNAPSQLTPALQTNILLQDDGERVHLTSGLIVEHSVRGTLSLGLAGSLSASLWNKNAQSLIKNSGALHVIGGLSLVGPTSSTDVSVQFNMTSESFIDFSTDVDFYSGVTTCPQMNRPTFDVRTEIRRTERCSGLDKRFRSRVRRSTTVHAMSYPLPARNSDNCRRLLAPVNV